MSAVTITADISAFRASLRKVLAVTKKEEADIVNKALKDVAFRSASFTPKVGASRIVQTLESNGLLPALASRACNKRYGVNVRGARKWGRTEHNIEMLRILTARKRGIGALRAGWIPAIQALGGSYRGAKVFPGGTAAKGSAKKATIARLEGIITNAVQTRDHNGTRFSAEQIAVAVSALAKAVAFVTKDRNDYAQRKIDALLKQHSD